MNRSDFQEAVWNGLGRAILYARDNDAGEFRDIILGACLHCYSADVQTEGTRALYMRDLVNVMPDRESYHAEVLKSLPGCGDDWDAVHRFRFASFLAMDGNDNARRAMYENFRPGPRMAEHSGVDFVQMDGLDGFLFAAEKMGALVLAKPDEVDEGYLLSYTLEALGEEQTLGALREAAKANPRIEAYRAVAEAGRQTTQGKPSRLNEREAINKLGYRDFKPRLVSRKISWADAGRWGEHTTVADLELAAQDLLAAQTAEEQLVYLRIFSRRAFPLDHDPLLQLAASDHKRVALAAAAALTRIVHPSVRDLALSLAADRRPGREGAIAMLARNWVPGDHEIAIAWFAQEEDRHARHGLSIDLRNLWDTHPDPTTEVGMWLAVYEKGPCSFCREIAVRRLIELESLPDAVREECAFDCNEDVRQLVSPPSAP